MSNVNDEFPYLEMNESFQLDVYLSKPRTPKVYQPIRTIAYLVRFIAVVMGVLGVGIMVVVVLFESSAVIIATGAGIVQIATAVGIYAAGSALDVLIDIAISIHKAAMSLEQLSNRNRRNN